jgi:mRNA-degrading endonuclease RelE of RelBE toxin-antitoxin system
MVTSSISMTYKILSSRQFESDFKKMDENFQTRVKNKMKDVSKNPERYKHMHYKFAGSSRVRIGKLRVVYTYSVDKKILYLEKIVFGYKYGL